MRVWKKVNARLWRKIKSIGGLELLNVRRFNYYWIEGMNQNHSNYFRGGFISHIDDFWLNNTHYIIDLNTMMIADSEALKRAA